MHVVLPVVLYAASPFLPFYAANETLVNTIAQIGALLLIYWMNRKKFLLNFILR